ncbi:MULTISPECIES: hypothetical protein [Intestinimonas]
MNKKIIPFPARKPMTARERREQKRQAEIRQFIAACERLYERQ